ncbi:RagB/SusD family nutrient uptake outer membrane protein [Phocaeicola sp. HCN-40430]|uniref:RagB/SusD family nutrient uptake outer membrane protein n=1 Tax=Phocaeicola sp. HCN-40430 TaxID=3134664 RepID=UPI0030BCCC3C
MKKNKFKIFAAMALASMLSFSSCNDYLEVSLQDQMTLEEVFSKRVTTERYWAHIYSYIPREYEYLSEGCAVPLSDEAQFSWYQWVDYLIFKTGSWGPTSTAYNIWKSKYTGINQATIFMDNVDRCQELDANSRKIMKAEVRFLRAFFYFELLRQYGPVYVWGDVAPDPLIKPDQVDRHTMDQNVNFIIEEFDKAIADLPLEVADMNEWAGRITKGAAMAIKSRVLLYAASPLFNGCDLYKGKMKNIYGEYIFPQQANPEKWTKAAEAAKAVIDMPQYKLYEATGESDPFQKAIKSYQGVLFDEWNSEIIWGAWARNPTNADFGSAEFFYITRFLPPTLLRNAFGGYCPSLKLVDTYPMAESGRYPVTGYDSNGQPIVDEKSGYKSTGFTANYSHPIDGAMGLINAHNSCVGRDARFYASILANGFYWINNYAGNKQVTFYTGGTSPYKGNDGDCVKVGFLFRRMVDPQLNTNNGNFGKVFWSYCRLAEVYLNYAEACNEKPQRDEAEALKYINKVRNRAGLNDLEEAYPEVIGNQDLLRELIRKERMVELAFEGHRYHDVRRWMIAEKELTGKNYTLNLLATEYEQSWNRTDQVWMGADNIFEPKHYFFPINQVQLSEMKNMTQNYGW